MARGTPWVDDRGMGTFFVPDAIPPDLDDKGRYEELARFAGRRPAAPERRIEQIEWWHDGESWTATVGQTMHGTKIRKATRKGKRVDVTDHLSDPARVLAIFGGDPTLVVTDAGFRPGARSAWVNPLMAGVPRVVRYFDPPNDPAPAVDELDDGESA